MNTPEFDTEQLQIRKIAVESGFVFQGLCRTPS